MRGTAGRPFRVSMQPGNARRACLFHFQTANDNMLASPLPLWERSDRIDRCDPGEGLRSIDRPRPLTPTLSHKGRGGARPPVQVLDSIFKQPKTRSFEIVIASGAKQSITPRKERMDCFAPLAMTKASAILLRFPNSSVFSVFSNTQSRSRGAFRPSFALKFPPSKAEGAGNAGRRCARSRACRVVSTRVSHHGHTGITRHSPRNGFNGFLRALPGDRACLPPSSRG